MANGKMTPVRVGAVPSEALKQGSLNETLPVEERNPPAPTKLESGPKQDAQGAFRPAAYLTSRNNIRQDR